MFTKFCSPGNVRVKGLLRGFVRAWASNPGGMPLTLLPSRGISPLWALRIFFPAYAAGVLSVGLEPTLTRF